MSPDNRSDLDPESIVNQLYDIALDPGSLNTFIDAWNSAGLDGHAARRTIQDIDTFDVAYSAHLNRAETFQMRDNDDGPALEDMLAPFDNLAAVIVNNAMQVVALNDGAASSFGLAEGDTLDKIETSPAGRDMFRDMMADLFEDSKNPNRLIKLEIGANEVQTLFQIRKLSETAANSSPLALIVTTQYHWQPAMGQTLEDVFALTAAEQGVVRALVEGSDAKTIAADRGTSEGTVRSQIKSILAKMNARSQSEVIRLVLSLRHITLGANADQKDALPTATPTLVNWLEAEVWKPFQTLKLPDGRRMDYHDMGPITGTPVLYSHMGYGLVRWTRPMVKLAFQHGLRVICPIRAGYGQSSNLDIKADLIGSTRDDTLFLLNHLGIKRLPYVTQGNDLLFATDLAAKRPDVVSEIIGICARPCLPGDIHYASMGKWHRFFLSTAKHAPHLLKFTTKAALSMTRRIGPVEMFRQTNKGSPADMVLLRDPETLPILIANGELIASRSNNAAHVFAMEILQTERDWSDLIIAAKSTPTWFVNGIEDPAVDMATITEYRETYPWIDIEVVADAGQLLLFQLFETLIPRLANAAKNA